MDAASVVFELDSQEEFRRAEAVASHFENMLLSPDPSRRQFGRSITVAEMLHGASSMRRQSVNASNANFEAL